MKRHLVVFACVFIVLTAAFSAANHLQGVTVPFAAFAALFAITLISFWTGQVRLFWRHRAPAAKFALACSSILGLGCTVFIPCMLNYHYINSRYLFTPRPYGNPEISIMHYVPYIRNYYLAGIMLCLLIAAVAAAVIVRQCVFKKLILSAGR